MVLATQVILQSWKFEACCKLFNNNIANTQHYYHNSSKAMTSLNMCPFIQESDQHHDATGPRMMLKKDERRKDEGRKEEGGKKIVTDEIAH